MIPDFDTLAEINRALREHGAPDRWPDADPHLLDFDPDQPRDRLGRWKSIARAWSMLSSQDQDVAGRVAADPSYRPPPPRSIIRPEVQAEHPEWIDPSGEPRVPLAAMGLADIGAAWPTFHKTPTPEEAEAAIDARLARLAPFVEHLRKHGRFGAPPPARPEAASNPLGVSDAAYRAIQNAKRWAPAYMLDYNPRQKRGPDGRWIDEHLLAVPDMQVAIEGYLARFREQHGGQEYRVHLTSFDGDGPVDRYHRSAGFGQFLRRGKLEADKLGIETKRVDAIDGRWKGLADPSSVWTLKDGDSIKTWAARMGKAFEQEGVHLFEFGDGPDLRVEASGVPKARRDEVAAALTEAGFPAASFYGRDGLVLDIPGDAEPILEEVLGRLGIKDVEATEGRMIDLDESEY